MNLDSFTGPGSTPSRRRFWDQVTQAVLASQKLEGKNVSVDEREGFGSVITVSGEGQRGGGGGGIGACCYNEGTCDDLTESDCTEAGGNWQGPGTTCDDDPNPCVGACCEGESGMTCVDDSTPDSCAADGGTFQDFGTTCADDPPPCPMPPCSCGFEAFDGSGRLFLTRTITSIGSTSVPFFPPTNPDTTLTWSSTKVETQDPDTCEVTCDSCSGSSSFFHQDLPGVPACTGTGTASCGGDTCVAHSLSVGVLEASSGCGWDYDTVCSDFSDAYVCGGLGCTTIPVSATEEQCHYYAVISPDNFVDATATITLSDECTPM